MKTIDEILSGYLYCEYIKDNKTLKEKQDLDNSIIAYSKNNLRQSAIEDVRKLRKKLKEWRNNIPKYCMSWKGDIILGKIDYIMEKFNLTEEDMK